MAEQVDDDLGVEDDWALFEQLGRRAAADLRTAPPEEGWRAVERTVHRRRATATVAGGVLLTVVVAGWFALTGSRHDEPGDRPMTPPQTSPVTPTTTMTPKPQ